MDPRRFLLLCACVAAVSASSEQTCVDGSRGTQTANHHTVGHNSRGPTVIKFPDLCSTNDMVLVGIKVHACSDDKNIKLIFDSLGDVRIIVAANAETEVIGTLSCISLPLPN